MMTIIERKEYTIRWRVTCPTCKSIVEGDPDDFKNKTSVTSSWYEFTCPACEQFQQMNTDYCFEKNVKRIRYSLNKDGSLGEEIKD